MMLTSDRSLRHAAWGRPNFRRALSLFLVSTIVPAFAAIFNYPAELPSHATYDYIVIGGMLPPCESCYRPTNTSCAQLGTREAWS